MKLIKTVTASTRKVVAAGLLTAGACVSIFAAAPASHAMATGPGPWGGPYDGIYMQSDGWGPVFTADGQVHVLAWAQTQTGTLSSVFLSQDGGPWTYVGEPAPITSGFGQWVGTAALGHTYQIAILATDGANQVWGYSPVERISLYEDTSKHISYSGAWKSTSNPKASGGSFHVLSGAGQASITIDKAIDIAPVVKYGPKSEGWGRYHVYSSAIGFWDQWASLVSPDGTALYRYYGDDWQANNVGTATPETFKFQRLSGRVNLDAFLVSSQV
jgi:hypothetical protein